MRKLSSCSRLKYYSSWKECSLDDNSKVCMINCDQKVINFDLVKQSYLNALDKSEECMASVDALGEDNDGHLYMIEFKNGEIDNDEIRNKIIESLMIFNDLTQSKMEDTRQIMDFVLVYNSDKIHYRDVEKRAIHLARMGKAPCLYHGLWKYHGVCVQKAYMMTATQFSKTLLGTIKTYK